MVAGDVLGLRVPDAGALFFAALFVHVLAGLTCVVTGALAATARKRPGRHPRSGRIYPCGVGVVFVTATVMAALRWREDRHLFAIAAVTFGLALFGWGARRRRRPGWVRWHAIGMGGSYIGLLTGFYVDNGPHLPLWDRLPHWMYWVLPAAVGAPLIWWALRRFRAGVSSRPRAAARSAAPTIRR
jgi:threonine/homoserine/homoserine lactone efflux protein